MTYSKKFVEVLVFGYLHGFLYEVVAVLVIQVVVVGFSTLQNLSDHDVAHRGVVVF